MRLAAQAKGGFYPTPSRVVDLIAEQIQPPARYDQRNPKTLRILDPCCGAGEAVAQLAGSPRRAQHDSRRDPRRRASPGQGRGGRVPAGPRTGRRPVRHLHGEWGLRPALPQPPIRLGPGGQTGRTRLPHPLHAVPRRVRAPGLSSCPGRGSPSRPATCPLTTGGCAAGPSPNLNGRCSTRWS